MKNNTTIAFTIVALIIGLGVGYKIGGNKTSVIQGEHMMPDGTIMGGGDHMSMEEMMTSMNAEIEGKSGDVFDQAFLSEMIVHHQGAVEMANLALTNAKHQEIKDLAKGIIAAQNKEITDMKAWLKNWYNK